MKKTGHVVKKMAAMVLCTALTVGMATPTELTDAKVAKSTKPCTSSLQSLRKALDVSRIVLDGNGVVTGSRNARKALRAKAASLPAKFDLRDVNGKNYVTSVKSQSPWNSCWSFADIAAAETSILYENGVTNEEYKEITGKELNFSEKALAWFSAHAITKDDVEIGAVPKSQIGEGFDGSEAEAINKNATYGFGGSAFLGCFLFASGMGPKSEYDRFEGEDDEYPFAYRGKNGWTNYDMYTMSDETRKLMYDYYDQTVRKTYPDKTEEEYKELAEKNYESNRKTALEKGGSDGLPYSPVDDWTIPIDYAHRTNYNSAMLQESNILPSPKYDPEGFLYSVKKELNAGRAVSIAYFAESAVNNALTQPSDKDTYMSDNYAQYTFNDEYANHCVTIVGYDDTYSRSNFKQGKAPVSGEDMTPPGDGAYIVKNSWGSLNDTSEGHHNTRDYGFNGSGYFYLSYYDKSIESGESFNFYSAKEVEGLTEGEENNYYINQYDFMPSLDIIHIYDEKPASMANVFKADVDQKLTRISVETGSYDGETTYEVYRLKPGFKNPRDGVLLEKGTESFEYSGYHSIHLKKMYPIAKGTSFSVVITNKVTAGSGTEEETAYEIHSAEWKTNEISFSKDNFTVNGVVNPGESMICRNGSWMDWADVSSYIEKSVRAFGETAYSFDNFGIKAYSIPAKKSEVRSANTIRLNGHSITKAKTIKVKKSAINKKTMFYMVTRNGKGKLSMKNKTSKKLKKYLTFKSDIVTLKKNAPKGKYRFTLTVAANGKWKKATTKLITIVVK